MFQGDKRGCGGGGRGRGEAEEEGDVSVEQVNERRYGFVTRDTGKEELREGEEVMVMADKHASRGMPRQAGMHSCCFSDTQMPGSECSVLPSHRRDFHPVSRVSESVERSGQKFG